MKKTKIRSINIQRSVSRRSRRSKLRQAPNFSYEVSIANCELSIANWYDLCLYRKKRQQPQDFSSANVILDQQYEAFFDEYKKSLSQEDLYLIKEIAQQLQLLALAAATEFMTLLLPR